MRGWKKNPQKVLEFHNMVMAECLKCEPNDAHKALVKLEEKYDVTVITQNIDNLHEKAGSTNVLHIHGNISESKSSLNPKKTYPIVGEIKIGDKAEDGSQLRHNTVLFEENLPHNEFTKATAAMENASILIIVGSSLVVYPAAGLISHFNVYENMNDYKNQNLNPIYIVDPNDCNLAKAAGRVFIKEKASIGVSKLVEDLMA
jgi:NAD-dependent deacetylase